MPNETNQQIQNLSSFKVPFHDLNECLDSKPRTLIMIFVTFDLKSKC